MEPITTGILLAPIIIFGRKFVINKGKKLVIDLLDKFGYLSAKTYLGKAIDCGDLDLSIEYTLKALKKNPNYKPALTWKEILQTNIEDKIKNLQDIKDNFLKEIKQKKSEIQEIRNAQSKLKHNIEDIKNNIIPLIIKYASLSGAITILLSYFFIFFLNVISNYQWTIFSILTIISITFPILIIYTNSHSKISLIEKEICNYDNQCKIIQDKIEEINNEIRKVDEGLAHLQNRKKILISVATVTQ